MRKKMTIILCGVILIAGLSARGFAEPPDYEGPSVKERAEDVRDRIETMKMWRLTKALDLDEKTSSRLFPLLNKNDRRRFEAERALREAMQDLREALRDKRAEKLKSLLDRTEQAHTEMMKINEEQRAELKKMLSLEQQAKYIIFQQEFDMEMRRMIREARERRGGRQGGERPFPTDRPERTFPAGRE